MSVHETLKMIQSRLLERPYLLRLGQLFSTTVLIQANEDRFFLAFENGALKSIILNPDIRLPWSFALRTDEDALVEFWRPFPMAGYHDIFGLAKIGRTEIEGDIILLVKNLRFFKETLALGRLETGQ